MTESTSPQDPEVGSLSEEATKLFSALTGWARDHGAEVGHGLSDVVDQASAAAHQVNEHLATDSAECSVCPVCRTVHAVRAMNPEVRSHLTSALTSLGHAASAFLSTQPPGPGDRSAGAHARRPDLDDEP